MRAREDDQRDPEAANARFADTVDTLAFKYRCEDCAHVAGPLERPTCSLGYPNTWLVGPHRLLEPDGMLTFCKYFELGE